MARKVMVTLADDLDGKDIPDNGGETVTFSLDGKTYELDLRHENAKKMRDAMGQYVQAARVLNLGHQRRGSGRSTSDRDRDKSKAIRAWAVMRGLMKPDARGRIPGSITEQYENRTAAEKVADDAKLRSLGGQQAIAETGGTTESKPAPAAAFSAPADKPAMSNRGDGQTRTIKAKDKQPTPA